MRIRKQSLLYTVLLVLVVQILNTLTGWFEFEKNEDYYHFKDLNSDRNEYTDPKDVLAVFVLSNRTAFVRREKIRKSWALGHRNVFFVVSQRYCPFSPECRVCGTCNSENHSLTMERLKAYHEKETFITRKLLDEPNVILVDSADTREDLEKRVTESYKWALSNLQADWFLHVEDSIEVKVDIIENYLKTTFDSPVKSAIFSSVLCISSMETEGNKDRFQGEFCCGMNHVVSRSLAQYVFVSLSHLFEYIKGNNYDAIRLSNSLNITSKKTENIGFIANGNCSAAESLYFHLCPSHNQTDKRLDKIFVRTRTSEMEAKYEAPTALSENPSFYLQSCRFDLIFKSVYAFFYVFNKQVPKVIKDVYTEHIRVWNHFYEPCKSIRNTWFDAKNKCKEKKNSSDFVSAFNEIIDSMKKYGFSSTMSRIPIDKTGFLSNGAHRLTAAIVLSMNATFEHHNYERRFYWGYKHFKQKRMSRSLIDFALLQWMNIQIHLPNLKTHVLIVSVLSTNHGQDEKTRNAVKEKCSKDGDILYEKVLTLTKNGLVQMMTHMYGQGSLLEEKISKIENSSSSRVQILFFYEKKSNDLLSCKHEIRKLYRDLINKSDVHIPETLEKNLILAEMVLNPNSLQFMNHAKDAFDCKFIAKEISTRSKIQPIKTLPEIYLGRDDVMIDSGTVLGFFGLRNRTNVDLLFLQDVDKSILGDQNGMNIQAHTFKFNSSSEVRARGEDHFRNEGPKDQWDLFYDPKNYGFCYGVKFVSLKQKGIK